MFVCFARFECYYYLQSKFFIRYYLTLVLTPLIDPFSCMSKSFEEYEICLEGKFVIMMILIIQFVSLSLSFWWTNIIQVGKGSQWMSAYVGILQWVIGSFGVYRCMSSYYMYAWKEECLNNALRTSSWREDSSHIIFYSWFVELQVCSILVSLWFECMKFNERGMILMVESLVIVCMRILSSLPSTLYH